MTEDKKPEHRKQIKQYLINNPGLSAITSNLHEAINMDEIPPSYNSGVSNYFKKLLGNLEGLKEVNGRWYITRRDK